MIETNRKHERNKCKQGRIIEEVKEREKKKKLKIETKNETRMGEKNMGYS